MEAAQDHDLASNDLGPLAWVLDELRKSLESASSALRRFVRDAALARGQDMASVDAGQLRIARQHMHQAVGALEMVGLQAPAHMLRSMEGAVQKFIERPELCTEAAAAKVERAGFALAEYLEALLAGKAVSPLNLFPQYKDVQELSGADRVHPADLWSLDFRWVDLQSPAVAKALVYEPAVRGRMDTAVLKIVKAADPAAGRELAEIALGLGASQAARQPKTFWRIAAGYFEAVSLGLLPPDIYVKRAASRVLMQYATLAKGDTNVSDRLAQDLVFFCAQAVPARPTDGPALMAVRQGYGLAKAKPADYATSPFGRFDPVLLSQLRKRIAAAKETWSSLAGGDAHKLKSVAEQFQAVCETLVKLYPAAVPLAQAMGSAMEALVRSARIPGPELAMEVATAVLYLEAAFQDLDPNDAQLAERTSRLAERLGKVVAGGQPEPLEHWVEDLYRRVSDRQTMGSVVGELRGTLGELEKVLDQFFRNPAEKGPLREAPNYLAQMRGVLSVLGLDQASHAVARMRDTVENIIVTEVDEEKARAAGTFDKLGINLGALGFLIDMLNYQPSLAKKLFVWDDLQGELRPLMGRAVEPNDEPPVELAQEVSDVVAEAGESGLGDLAPKLDTIAAHATLADNKAVASAAREASAAVSAKDEAGAAAALTTLAAASQPPTPQPTAAPVAADDFEEDDLRDIFLEEAREVVGTGLAALAVLDVEPGNLAEMTTLRRAFHTLKGSSRMVGLNEFGEAGWSLEQVMNTWLADQKPSTEPLRALCKQALQSFGRWIEDIATNTDGAWKAGMFRGPADAMRTENRLLEIGSPAAADAAPVLAPAAAPAIEQVALAQAPEVPQLPPIDAPSIIEVPAIEVPVAAEAPAAPADFDFSFDVATPTAAPEAAAPAADPVPELSDFGLSFDVTPAAPAADAVAELPDFAMDFTPAQAEAPATTERGAVTEPDELSMDELPPEFAELASTVILPRPADPEPEPLPAFDPSTTTVQARYEPAAPQPAPQPDLVVEAFDFTNLAPAPAAPAPAPVVAPAPVAEPVQAFVPAAPAVVEPAPVVEPVIAPAPAPAVAAVPVVEAAPVAAAVAPTAAEVAAEAAAAEAAAPRDEQVKVIGSLRIGIPLYNVYLNEADEWSRRLATEISEWALEMNQRVPDSTVGWAHSLAGSSATVGFHALSDIARALEGALQHTQAIACGTPDHARTFTEAAEEVRRLLHQFAAGFLKEPDARLLRELQELKDAEGEARPEPVRGEAPVSGFADLDFQSFGDAPQVAQPAPARPQPMAPVQSGPMLQPVQSMPLAPQRAVVSVSDEDDDLDVTDAIDPDLFPIFEEEAAELMPAMGSSLRLWAAHPSQREPRDQVLRALHTLKGSARLAGALRLGELAHRMESAVEHLGSDNIAAADIEELLQRFDTMQARFDTLRATGGFAPAEVEADAPAPVQVLEQPAAQQAAASADVQPFQVQPAGAPRTAVAMPVTTALSPSRQVSNQAVRVRSQLLDRLVNQAGEVMITRSRLESELKQLRGSLGDLTGNLDRLRSQLREIEVQAESQMQSRMAQAKDTAAGFDPLEFDRFTRVQELTRLMAESVNDVATVQRNIHRVVEATEDDLIAQARQTRELQRDLLRTRMVEFEGISDRLYRVVRLAAKESGKQVKLDIVGGSIEMDRGVLDRMTPAFEHLLRNCVAHGIELAEHRTAAGKEPTGAIAIHVRQEGNDVSVEFQDDGAGLNVQRIREKALQQGMITPDQPLSDAEAANLIFLPGFSTAAQVTELAGRGIGMDVVRNEVNALGGRIETTTQPGRGTSFKLVLPLTTAVTQVVMIRSGKLAVGVPANLVELVRRGTLKEVQQAYNSGSFEFAGEQIPFFWSGALLQSSTRSTEPQGKTLPVVIFRSAAQRIAVHVDEVLGNQEVVVKNLGPQMSRLPGLAGMTVLASGAVVLIYNPVALTTVYGDQARQMSADSAQPDVLGQPAQPVAPLLPVAPTVPLVLVVDDSITVRRVTQRLLQREGYRVALAADGLQALERLADELPSVVLSDIEMPRMDGFDLARNIRGDARLAHLPIVMITSRIAEKHREHARELGVNHYLGKPYSEEELMSLVKHYCSQPVAA